MPLGHCPPRVSAAPCRGLRPLEPGCQQVRVTFAGRALCGGTWEQARPLCGPHLLAGICSVPARLPGQAVVRTAARDVRHGGGLPCARLGFVAECRSRRALRRWHGRVGPELPGPWCGDGPVCVRTLARWRSGRRPAIEVPSEPLPAQTPVPWGLWWPLPYSPVSSSDRWSSCWSC